MQEKKLGFIGVGQLAQPMVKHLLDQGYEVLVHNRRRDPLEKLISKGAVYCQSPKDAVIEGGIVFNCLPDDTALLSVFHAHGTIFRKLGDEGLHVSMATISPQASRIVHERHKTLGGNYCVATVMGRPDVVENKKHFYIMAGEPDQLDRVRPVLLSPLAVASSPWEKIRRLRTLRSFHSTFSSRRQLSLWLRLSRLPGKMA